MKPTAEQLEDPKWWDENAPEGAQFWSFDKFRKHESSREFMWCTEGWTETSFDKLNYHKRRAQFFAERPTHPVDATEKVERSKYHHEIAPGVWVDVYDVIKAWSVTNPAQQHLIKKALQAGDRGHKDYDQDMDDIIASAERAKQLNAPAR